MMNAETRQVIEQAIADTLLHGGLSGGSQTAVTAATNAVCAALASRDGAPAATEPHGWLVEGPRRRFFVDNEERARPYETAGYTVRPVVYAAPPAPVSPASATDPLAGPRYAVVFAACSYIAGTASYEVLARMVSAYQQAVDADDDVPVSPADCPDGGAGLGALGDGVRFGGQPIMRDAEQFPRVEMDRRTQCTGTVAFLRHRAALERGRAPALSDWLDSAANDLEDAAAALRERDAAVGQVRALVEKWRGEALRARAEEESTMEYVLTACSEELAAALAGAPHPDPQTPQTLVRLTNPPRMTPHFHLDCPVDDEEDEALDRIFGPESRPKPDGAAPQQDGSQP